MPWGPLGIEQTVRVEVALLVNTSDMKADRALSPFMDTGANSCCGGCNYNRADADARTPHSFLRVARGIDKPKWRMRTPVKLESLLDEMFALPKNEQRSDFGREHGLRHNGRSVRRPVTRPVSRPVTCPVTCPETHPPRCSAITRCTRGTCLASGCSR